MNRDTEMPAPPLTWRGFLVLGAAGALAYAVITAFGEIAVGAIAGLTVGYLFARITNL